MLNVVITLLMSAALAGESNKRLSDEARGELLYERHCLVCHGALAKGDGPAAASLAVPIPDLQGQLSKEIREQMLRVVMDGKGVMPAYQLSVDRHDGRRVLRYMEGLGKAKPEEVEEPAQETEEPKSEEPVEAKP